MYLGERVLKLPLRPVEGVDVDLIRVGRDRDLWQCASVSQAARVREVGGGDERERSPLKAWAESGAMDSW